MASSSIKIALEMTGVQAYANATERAAQANEKLAERSKKSIAGIMSSTQRMVDMATKSKEQMTLEKLSASNASPEQIAQVKARFAQVEQVRAAEKAAAAAKAAEEQRAKEQAMAQAAAAREAAEARRAAEVAAAQRSKETQLKIHKQLMAEKAAAEQKYQRTQQYAESTKSGPMFGKTLGPLLKGFVGFKAVDFGLGAMANALDQLASGGKVDKLKVYSDTMIGFVKGLPAGDHIMGIAKGVHALLGWGGGPDAIDAQTRAIEAQTAAMSRRLTAEESFRQKMEQIRRDRSKVGKSEDEIARLDREAELADQRQNLIGKGMGGQEADKKIAQMRAAMAGLDQAKLRAEMLNQANRADPALHLSMLQEQQRIAHELVTSERDLYAEKTAQLVLEGRITEAQAKQLRDAYDKTAATRAEVEQRKKSEESMKQQAELAKQMEQQATDRAGRMMNFGNAESLSTAIGGVKVAGMTSFSLERMMPTQEAMKLALQQIAKNTAPLAAGAP